MSHFDGSFDRLDLHILLVKFTRLLPDRPLVTVDQLMCLLLLLVVRLTFPARRWVSSVRCQTVRLLGGCQRILNLSRVEHLCVIRGVLDRFTLRKSGTVHVFKKFVLLDELVFEDLQLCVDFAVLVAEAVDLDLCVHVLLVEVLA